MKKASLIISFMASLLTFLLSFWTAGYSLYAAGWTESVLYFVLTAILLEKYAEAETYGVSIVVAVILGRIVLELPIRATEFSDTLFSLFVPIVVLASIILSSIYFKEKRPSVLVLAAIIIVLLNTVVHEDWVSLFAHT